MFISIHFGIDQKEKGVEFKTVMSEFLEIQYESIDEKSNIEYVLIDGAFFVSIVGILIVYLIPFPFIVWDIILVLCIVSTLFYIIIVFLDMYKDILEERKRKLERKLERSTK